MTERSFSNISFITEPGSLRKHNEDIFIVDDRLLVVIDGATGLGKRLVSRVSSDAYWFVNEIKREIRQKRPVCSSFPDLMNNVIESVTQKYFLRLGRKHPHLEGIQKYEMPSASMVALSLEKGGVSAFRMGDCDLLWKQRGKVVQLFSESPLVAMDRRSIDAYVRMLRQGRRFDEARAEIHPLLIEHRNRLNEEGGYGALTTQVGCMHYLETQAIDASLGDEFILCSDGVSPAYESYRVLAKEDMFRCSPRDALKAVRNVETCDAGMSRFPRLKVSDDATLVRATLTSH